MEPDEPTLFNIHSTAPVKTSLPPTYREWLKMTWTNYPSTVRISRRMIPVKHVIIFSILLLAFSALCYVAGLVFWKLAVPSEYATQRADTITRFLAGWFIIATIAIFGIALGFIWALVSIICCGKGVEKRI